MARSFQDDIKKIVGVSDTSNSGLEALRPTTPIYGGRGIMYFDNDGNAKTTSGSAPRLNEDGEKEEGTLPPETTTTSSGSGSGSGGAAGGNTLSSESAATSTELADDESAGVYSVTATGFEGMSVGTTANGVTGLYDCETGDPVDIRFDGNYSPPDGCGVEEWPNTTDSINDDCSKVPCPADNDILTESGMYSSTDQRMYYIGYYTSRAGDSTIPDGYTQKNICTSCPVDEWDEQHPQLIQSNETFPTQPLEATESWDDAYSAPTDETYESGYHWDRQGSASYNGTNGRVATISEAINRLQKEYPTGKASYYDNEVITPWHAIVEDGERFAKLVYQHRDPNTGAPVGGERIDKLLYEKRPCLEADADEYYCTFTPNAKWPECKPTQMSYDSENNKYVANPYDDNVLDKYKAGVSQLTLCNEIGETIKTYPTADGGQVLYNQDTDIGVFMDSSGKVTGYGDAAAITASTPK